MKSLKKTQEQADTLISFNDKGKIDYLMKKHAQLLTWSICKMFYKDDKVIKVDNRPIDAQVDYMAIWKAREAFFA